MTEKLKGVDEHQPMPTPNESGGIQDLVIQDVYMRHSYRSVHALVIADIEARKQVGLERYGTLLQPFNGRDALLDAYQETLDLCQYLRQCQAEGITWIDVTYASALRMALHLRALIEDRNHEASRVTALGDPARGD